ncbi:hypothetical protein T01_5371 [Trichinella spiralis]|uniref:Uncharacterized protein n=1 Tax=Trichinella spiralis TaxID=6334 RepID=A0A0V1AP11_TRISP|nr:hypothetical protein T01_5371 [Trichinella spiralis]
MRANRKHHSDIGRFNLHITNYRDLLVITDYIDFRKYFPTAELLDEVVQKTIRLFDVIETLMVFQEHCVLGCLITTVCSGDVILH